MKAGTANLFGPAMLRQAGPRSSIFDQWYADLGVDQQGPSCLLRRLLPPYSLAPEYILSFEARLKEIKRFDHPASLVPVYWNIEAGIPYCLQELPTGWNLQDILTECLERHIAIPPDLAIQMMFPGAHALASAHARPGNPMVHGAVRPCSFWLEGDGRTRLADFDIGALAEFELRGSDGWQLNGWRCVAPERSRTWSAPSPQVDVYSLAAVLLELLCVGRLSEVQYQSELGDRLALLMAQQLPVPLLKLLAACHAEAPEQRPTMAALAESLKELGRQLPRTLALQDFLARTAPPRRDIMLRSEGAAFKKLLKQYPPLGFSVQTPTGNSDAGADAAAKASQAGNAAKPAPGRARLYGLLVLVLLAVGGAIAFKKGLLVKPAGPDIVLTVESEPEGAQIYQADGSLLGFAPVKASLTPGRTSELTLEARLDGYTSQQQTQHLSDPPVPGEVLAFHFKLARTAGTSAASSPRSPNGTVAHGAGERGKANPDANIGYLKVLSTPPAEVYINGNPFGSSGPDLKIKLAPGRQTVELAENGGERTARYEARIEAGQTLRLSYDFGGRRWRLGTESAQEEKSATDSGAPSHEGATQAPDTAPSPSTQTGNDGPESGTAGAQQNGSESAVGNSP